MNTMFKNLFLWAVIAIVLIAVFSNFTPRHQATTQYSYSQFIQAVSNGNISSVTIQDRTIRGMTKDNKTFTTYLPMSDQYLLGELIKKGVSVKGVSSQPSGGDGSLPSNISLI